MQQRIYKQHRPTRRNRADVAVDTPAPNAEDITAARETAAAAQATVDAIDAVLAGA